MLGSSGNRTLYPHISPLSIWDDDLPSLIDVVPSRWLTRKPSPLAFDKIVQSQSYTYRFDMPGFTMKDIKIELDTDKKVLYINAMRSEEHTHREPKGLDGSYAYSLRSMGGISESIYLDKDTYLDCAQHTKSIQAHLENGVLSITFPRISLAPPPKKKNVKNIPISMGPNTMPFSRP